MNLPQMLEPGKVLDLAFLPTSELWSLISA